MDLNSFNRLIWSFLFLLILELVVIKSDENNTKISANNDLDSVFNGVYTECFMHLSYMCLQKKTLLYLRELNNLSEVSVFGDYVKFVKVNSTIMEDYRKEQLEKSGDSDELAFMIDRAVDNFFDNHVLKFSALGRDIALPRNVDEFVGRKRKGGGGGGGGGHGGGHGGGDDGGKKKMMMMAMMCMKMKLMMMVPAMMGMMGMMSFKGMMFSMMSFMLSKMMLLMKLLEKRGGAGGFGGGAGDGGWMAGGGGGGAWMPAGGQDYAGGGGGGGGYDANGQWQSRSIAETPEALIDNKPIISFVKPIVSYNGNIGTGVLKKPILVYKKSNINFELDKEHENVIDEHRERKNVRLSRDLYHNDANKYYKNDDLYPKLTDDIDRNQNENKIEDNPMIFKDTSVIEEEKRRSKRSIIDTLQNSYIYWINRILGLNNNRRTNYQRHKIINGIKYVYHPYPTRIMKQKTPKEIPVDNIKISDDSFTPILTADDFNKGEIMEGGVESRMNKKKFNKMKDTVNDTVEENPWE